MLRPIVRSLSKSSDNATTDDLFIDHWPSETNICWTRIVAINDTHQGTRTEIALLRGSEFYPLKVAQPGAATYSVETDTPIYAPGDFRVGARFWGATAADKLKVYAFGYVIE
jgi:hypothetical protein